jgi:hypothetical protein
MKNKKIIIADFYLKYPYNASMFVLSDLIGTWGLRLLKSSTYEEVVSISIPYKKFKSIFNISPKIGEIEVPEGCKSFLSKINIIKITLEEL